jgi:hypothetical protein
MMIRYIDEVDDGGIDVDELYGMRVVASRVGGVRVIRRGTL